MVDRPNAGRTQVEDVKIDNACEIALLEMDFTKQTCTTG